MEATEVLTHLQERADPEKAEHSRSYFKSGAGGYGEGDEFLGIRVPEIRKAARKFRQLSLDETEVLLRSKFHEARLCALIILVKKFEKGEPDQCAEIFELYLQNRQYINNWDLVDVSAPSIPGAYLWNHREEIGILQELAESDRIWDRRLAIMSTLYFIRQGSYDPTLQLAKKLLADDEDLIHKAVGWMLREVGKQNMPTEEAFLKKYVHRMPRTMLRYAIEKFPEPKRKRYLQM